MTNERKEELQKEYEEKSKALQQILEDPKKMEERLKRPGENVFANFSDAIASCRITATSIEDIEFRPFHYAH